MTTFRLFLALLVASLLSIESSPPGAQSGALPVVMEVVQAVSSVGADAGVMQRPTVWRGLTNCQKEDASAALEPEASDIEDNGEDVSAASELKSAELAALYPMSLARTRRGVWPAVLWVAPLLTSGDPRAPPAPDQS